MSDPSINADLTLSIANALTEVQRLQRALDQALADVTLTITADTGGVAGQITAAVDNADGTVDVDADTATVPAEISTAVDNADGTFDADADTAGVAGEISTAVDGADGTFDADADTAGVPAEISAAVDNADGTVDVDADTAGMAGQINSAVANADSTVDVDADTQGIGGQISRAVDNADTNVQITADTAEAQRQISALEDRLSAAEAESAALALELSRLANTGGASAASLVVGFRGLAAVIGGVLAGSFAQVGLQFNELQQRSRAALDTLLGGAEAATKQLSELNAFASESPFPRQAFLEAQQTLIAFGVAAEDVVPTLSAIQDALAASGQSGDQIGELAIIFGQIQSAGRITAEELNQFAERGVNAAQLIGDQMGLTAGEIREQITSGALDAETALRNLRVGMQEEFEGAAAGVRETFAGARDRVRAALRDISSDLFTTFVDPQGGGAAVTFFNDLADAIRLFGTEASASIAGAGGSLVPVLESLGQDLLPAVAASLAELVPLLGTTGTFAQALVPVFQLVGAGLDAIPGPILQAVTAFAALNALGVAGRLQSIGQTIGIVGLQIQDFARNAAQAQVQTGSWRNALAGTGGPLQGLLRSIGPTTIATAGLALGVTLLAQRQQEAAQAAAEHRERVDTLKNSIAEAETVAEGLELGFERLAEEGDSAALGVTAAGLSAEEMQTIAREAANDTEALVAAVDAASFSAKDSVRNFDGFRDALQNGESATAAMRQAISETDAEITDLDFTEAEEELIRVTEAAEDQIDALEDVARSRIEAAVSAEDLSRADADLILDADDLVDAWLDWEEQLEATRAAQEESLSVGLRQAEAAGQITNAQRREIEAIEDLDAAERELADATTRSGDAAAVVSGIYETYSDATGRAANQARDVADAVGTVDAVLRFTRDAASDAGQGFIDLDLALQAAGLDMRNVDSEAEALQLSMANMAVAIDSANLPAEELEKIAQGLGFSFEDFSFFVETTAGVVNDFTSAVESNIPTVSDAVGELDDLTLSGIRDSVFDTLDAIEQFADDIDTLSIRPAIQRLAIEEGPELAAVLADAQRNGNDAMLDEIEDGLVQVDDARQGLIDDARVFAVEFAVAMGLIAEIGVEAFAEQFDIESPTLDEMSRTGDALSDAALGQIAKEQGDTVTREYGNGVSGMVPESARITRKAVAELENQFPAFSSAGREDGDAARSGFKTGLAPLPGETGTTMNQAVFAVATRRGPSQTAGLGVGTGAKAGVNLGLAGVVGDTRSTMDSTIGAVLGRRGSGRSAGSSVGSAIKGGTDSGLAGIVEIVRKAAFAAARTAGDAKAVAFSQGRAIGSDIGAGMSAGIRAQSGNVIAAAVGLARSATNSAKAELAIASPSLVFRELGEEIGEGLRLGILDEVDAVTAATDDLVRAVADVEPPTIPVATLDPQIAGLAIGQQVRRIAGVDDLEAVGPGGGVTNVTVEAGAIVINVPPGTTPAAAERLGDRAARGFLQTLAQRRVLVDARTAR